MTASPGPTASLRLSTDEVPAIEREGVARELFGRQIMRLEGEPIQGLPLRIDVTMRMLPGLKLVSGPVTGLDTRRTQELLSDGNDDLFLAIGQRGQMIIRQRDREADLVPGTAFVGSCGERGDFIHVGCDSIRLMVPRQELAPFVPNLEDRLATPLPAESEALRLLLAYLSVLDDGALTGEPDLRWAVVTHIHDLMALAIGAGRDAGAFAAGRGLRAARLHAIKADISGRIGGGPVSAEDVAGRHGI